MSNPKANIKLFENHAEVVVTNPDTGSVHSKAVSLDGLVSILQKQDNFVNTIDSHSTIKLLPQYVRGIAETDKKVAVVFEYPEFVAPFTYLAQSNRDQFSATAFGVEKLDERRPNTYTTEIVYPNTVFVLFADKSGTKTAPRFRFREMYVYCLNGPLISLSAEIFAWPGGNVFEQGLCCTGDGINLEVDSLQGLSRYPSAFLFGVNTSHIDRLFNHRNITLPATTYHKDGELDTYDIDMSNITGSDFMRLHTVIPDKPRPSFQYGALRKHSRKTLDTVLRNNNTTVVL